jgi:hypothetical protein
LAFRKMKKNVIPAWIIQLRPPPTGMTMAIKTNPTHTNNNTLVN